jgi:hypothetical protein
VDKAKLTSGTRVALDMTTLTIMRALPREVGWEVGGARLLGLWVCCLICALALCWLDGGLTSGTQFALEVTTLTIMRALSREVGSGGFD